MAKKLSWDIKPELVEATMKLFIETKHKEEFCGYLGFLVEKIKSGEADQDKLITELNKEWKKRAQKTLV